MTAFLYAIAYGLAGAVVTLVLVRCIQYLHEPDIDRIEADEAKNDWIEP